MYICLCHGVSDKKIKTLVQAGNSDLRSIRSVCNAGGDCGKCICDLKKIISECHKEKHAETADQT